MSWALNEDSSRRSGQSVTSQDLEERINMYISAMDKATSVNDESMSTQLQRDIQHLVDLMEKITSGQFVMDTEVPPPLVMTPIHDVVANPLGELSSRLSDYHKALYFAEEELSENRLEKIQTLQKGLQTIHNLQKRAQAGFPIKEDEIPAPVVIPDDSEFDNDAINTISTRLEQYQSALNFCEKSTGTDRRRIPKLQSSIRKLNFLLTRAQVKRPVWRKDIPAEFDYFYQQSPEMRTKSENVTKLTIQARALQHRVSKCTNPKLQETKNNITEGLEKLINKWTESKVVTSEDSTNLSTFSAMLDNLEKNTDSPAMPQATPSSGEELNSVEDGNTKAMSDLELIDCRIKEYKTAALNAKRKGNVNQAIKDLKVVKGLQPMKDALEKGEKVDMTLVPPPPQDASSGDLPPSFSSLAESNTKSAIEPAPQSAHAQVSPFNIRPTTETAEDKLARKLTSFLEDEGEIKSFTSASSSSPSSLESDLSPVHRLEANNEKLKMLNETEQELMSDMIPKNSSYSILDSTESQNVSSDSGADRHGQALEGKDIPSTDVKEDTNKVIDFLHTETVSGDVEKCDNDATSVVENECVKDEKAMEKDEDLRNEIMNKGEKKETQTFSKETSKTDVGDRNDNSASPTKVTTSKNPLDKIGFLACQDVPLSDKEQSQLSVCQNVNTTDSTISLPGTNVECQEQSQIEKDSNLSLGSDLNSANDLEVNSASCSVPSLCSNTTSDKINSSRESMKFTNNSESSTSESSSSVNKSHGQFPHSDSSIHSSMPYSVNSHIVNTKNDLPSEKLLKNEPPYNVEKSEDIIKGKSDVRNFYNLSGDDLNSDDALDMQEFQELMDSMSIESDTSSLTTGGASNIQSYDRATLSNPNPNLLNALYSPAIPEPASFSSSDVKHSIMNQNIAASDSSLENLMKKNTIAQSNAQPLTAMNMLTDLGTTLNKVCYSSESLANCASSKSCAASSLQNIQLTCLETLKYDLLLAESKSTQSAMKEAKQLQEQMEKIKHHLRHGGRNVWEEYKSCLEKELQDLNKGVRDCGERQEWDTYKYLNNKRMLNEKELCYLKQRIGEIKE